MLVVLCLSNAARCSIDANFDDAGTGILAASSPVLLGKHSHFCRYRRIASIALRIFLFSNEKRSSACHCSTSLFTYQWELQWARAPATFEEAPVAESLTMDASDADCACFSDCGAEGGN